MKVTRAEFQAAATTPRSIPKARHPEIAVAGRSNVGKSSLINRLLGRRRLARTSATPGCTRGLVFFAVNDALSIVDLPGYGYASRSAAERKRWKTLVERYLVTREELAGVLILVDVRRGPQDDEHMLAEFLERHGLAYAWVVTKCDKLARGKLQHRLGELREEFRGAPALLTSAETGAGISELWSWIAAAIA